MKQRAEIEYAAMFETCERSARARLVRVRHDLRLYEVSIAVRTLVRRGGVPQPEERSVEVLYQIHEEHPFVPPIAVARPRDLFNPHVLDPEAHPEVAPVPVVCLGAFQPQMRLADWVVATYDVLRLRRVAPESPLNEEAAAWVRARLASPGSLPLDPRSFWLDEAPAAPGPAASAVSCGAEPRVRFRSEWRMP